MKRLLLFLFASFFAYSAIAMQELSITVNDDSITVTGDSLIPVYFTPGIHDTDSTCGIFDNGLSAVLPAFSRDASAGAKSGMGFYHLTSGPVLAKFDDSLRVEFSAPGKNIFCQGKKFENKAVVEFPNLFTAREFPFFWADSGQYETRTYWMSNLDSVKAIFIWPDSSGRALLDTARVITAAAVKEVGKVAPNFWHKYIQNWGGGTYQLVVFLGTAYDGLEHFSSPYVSINEDYLATLKQLVVHEMFHSFVGKSLMPPQYITARDKYVPTDILWYYEGLTTLIGDRYNMFPDLFDYYFAQHFLESVIVEQNNLMRLSRESSTNRGGQAYYDKGYLLFLCLASQINLDDWLNWLFEQKLLNRQIPIPTNGDSIITWLNEFKPGAGEYVKKLLPGDYMQIADSLLYYHGFRKELLHEFSNNYIGPYHRSKNYIFSDMDQYNLDPKDYKFICVLKGGDSLGLKDGEPGWELISSNPDSIFSFVIESNGERKIIKTPKNLRLPNGEPFFTGLKLHMVQIPLFRRRDSLLFLRQLIREGKK